MTPFFVRKLYVLPAILLWGASLSSAQSDYPDLPPSATASAVSRDAHAQIAGLVRAKKWAELSELTGKLRRQSPRDPTTLYWLGISKLELRDALGAVQALRAAEKLGLNTAGFHECLGLAYYELNQFGLFEEQMRKAAGLDPADAKPYYYLGLYRRSIRADPFGALELFDQAIRLDPNDWKSLYQAGNCLEQLQRTKEARDRYEKAIRLVEENGAKFGWPYQGMARLLLDDDPQRALAFARKAGDLEPNEYSNHLVLAKVYEAVDRLSDAIAEARSAAVQKPTDATTSYTLYKRYKHAGDPRSVEELKRFEEITAMYEPD